MSDKIVVTNLSALKAKYGAGLAKIKAAVDRLIAADKKHGLETRLVALDDATSMKKLNAPPVLKADDPKQNKMAIDAIYKALVPEYLLILGSTDIIPHQDLKNPVFDPRNDPDEYAFGDLPYACESAYSRKPEDFIGPTRVVGRLPDLTGAREPSYLVSLLDTAANWKALPPGQYTSYLGISAAVWEGSTRMSLENLFGSGSDLQLSPKKGPKWTKELLDRRIHFINCHGAEATSQFFGQQGADFPIAHDAKLLKGKIKEGTVAAAECCYGAQLYDSFLLGNGQSGICNTYLASKAYGFFGSTTIAYGPADRNGSADLICRFFLKHVLEGASLGRAALEARQEFIASSTHMDPMDLKTLAQFHLLGDPSITPVQVPTPHTAMATKAAKELSAQAIDRSERRQQLHAKGLYLAKNQPVVHSVPKVKAGRSIQAALKKIADTVQIKQHSILSFDIAHAPVPKTMMAKAITPTAFHVILGVKPTKKNQSPVPQVVAVVAKEVNGKIVSFRELHRR